MLRHIAMKRPWELTLAGPVDIVAWMAVWKVKQIKSVGALDGGSSLFLDASAS